MTLLLISPDYASHAIPLLTIAGAWRQRGHRVVVATGSSVEPLVLAAGMEYTELVMSRGSNTGLLRPGSMADDERSNLVRFFEATKQGMIETLRYQAQARSLDLLWRPREVAVRTMAIVEAVQPDHIIVDHLAFAATIGLRALQVPFADVVLGHPTSLPIDQEVYGVPSAWPSVLDVDVVRLGELRAMAQDVVEAFTNLYDDTLHELAPGASAVDDAFKAHGDLVLFNYPAALHGPIRTGLLPHHRFLGSSVREEQLSPAVARWLERPGPEHLVVVSFGTFLSARIDVLRRVAAALHSVEARVAIAIGNNAAHELGDIPADWLVMPSLPQVGLLRHADTLVTHGGNNSVTEALTQGVPMVVMPFSTDQFDGAAAIERSLTGVALDPNGASRPLIAGTVRGLLRTPPPESASIMGSIDENSGPAIVYDALASGTGPAQRSPVNDHVLDQAVASP